MQAYIFYTSLMHPKMASEPQASILNIESSCLGSGLRGSWPNKITSSLTSQRFINQPICWQLVITTIHSKKLIFVGRFCGPLGFLSETMKFSVGYIESWQQHVISYRMRQQVRK